MHFICNIFFHEYNNFIINFTYTNHHFKIKIKYYICINLLYNFII